MAHIVGDGAAAEGQAAEHGHGLVGGPAKRAARHFRHAGKTAVKLDKIKISGGHLIQLQGAANGRVHADRAAIVIPLQDIAVLLGCGPHADIDQAVFGYAQASGLGQTGDEEGRALIDRTIGHHQLVVGKGDGTVGFGRGEYLFSWGDFANPGPVIGRRHLGEQRPDLAAFRLAFA